MIIVLIKRMYKITGYHTKDNQLISAYISQGLVPGVSFMIDRQSRDCVIVNVDGHSVALRLDEFRGISCES